MDTDPRERLAQFSADALDWPAVRELLRAHVVSPLGQRALDELAPRDDESARAALARARELTALLLAEDLEPPLGGASDPRAGLAAALEFRRSLTPDELGALARFLAALADVRVWLLARRSILPSCNVLFERLPDLVGLREELDTALDPKGRVRDDASPLLKRLRVGLHDLEQAVERLFRGLQRDPAVRAAVAEGHAGRVHRRGGRPVLALRAQHARRVPGIVHDRSQTGDTLFVEPEAAVKHGNAMAELAADAEREEQRILAELTRRVLQHRDSVLLAAERASELELAAVAARYARATGGCVPDVAGESAGDAGLLLRAFRHPLLLEQQRRGTLAEVVPLDLRLGPEFELLLVTGPNTGGKTLVLKSAGLAALLARLGFALPCEAGSRVPLYDGVAADIGDEQEIQQNLSTFSSHLVRIRAGLGRCSRRTLFLLDELGGGTDPSEGAALGEALLAELLVRGVPTLASTHLGALKDFVYRNARAENAHVEFDVESLRPLYTLVIGAPGHSRALEVARRLGLPATIVDRAEGLLGRTARPLPLDELRVLRTEAERLRGEAEARAHALAAERDELARAREDLAVRASLLAGEAQRGIEERTMRAREVLARLTSVLPQLPPVARGELARLAEELATALGDADLSERRAHFLKGLDKGALVWLPRFKKRVQVVRIHRDRREIDVKLGARELRVAFEDVTFYESL